MCKIRLRAKARALRERLRRMRKYGMDSKTFRKKLLRLGWVAVRSSFLWWSLLKALETVEKRLTGVENVGGVLRLLLGRSSSVEALRFLMDQDSILSGLLLICVCYYGYVIVELFSES